ncbi:hypothetical protein FHX42_005078 [Saccharopolyspora lacisalsi]|uniref:DUF6802 domain-containing protein n=1 Tax=Halosaccharopolyspora lacisalsi TaxID=1000566 RepID=A0A839E308_9PSEU|nr:DUF6802 family protein [Halosaccharopolyspora lacisalsi]MBA8827673.1 hypothetical protein [Halosaccharopolyspora lacisalsi]
MYVENTGAGDGDVQVTVDGQEYTAEANYDVDGNGVDETVAVMTGDGFLAYTDADADGRADVMRTIDSRGEVTSQAGYDETTGEWVAEPPQQPGAVDTGDDADAKSLFVDTPEGDHSVGPPTEDTNDDGKPDTAIVDTETGQMMVTDVDGDGSADQLVEISDSGEVTVAHHTGEGQWTVVEQGRLDQRGEYAPERSAEGDEVWRFEEQDRPESARSAGYQQAAPDSAWK